MKAAWWMATWCWPMRSQCRMPYTMHRGHGIVWALVTPVHGQAPHAAAQRCMPLPACSCCQPAHLAGWYGLCPWLEGRGLALMLVLLLQLKHPPVYAGTLLWWCAPTGLLPCSACTHASACKIEIGKQHQTSTDCLLAHN